jgi:L-cysteine/cystine lyase
MFPVDLRDIDCDFYASSCHKWMCAPRGTGVLYVKKGLLDTVQTRFVGGYTDLGWDLTVEPPEFKGYVPTAHRYDYGTQSAPLFIGVAAAVDFLTGIGMEHIGRHGTGLATILQQQLILLGENVEMLTPTEERSRGSMIGFRLKTMPNDKFGELASKNGFRIRLVPESHLNSIRISTHMYNNEEEVSRFVEVVKNAIK